VRGEHLPRLAARGRRLVQPLQRQLRHAADRCAGLIHSALYLQRNRGFAEHRRRHVLHFAAVLPPALSSALRERCDNSNPVPRRYRDPLPERVLSGHKNAQIAGSTLLLKASLVGSVGLLAACGQIEPKLATDPNTLAPPSAAKTVGAGRGDADPRRPSHNGIVRRAVALGSGSD
jgi:hypothetical protein